MLVGGGWCENDGANPPGFIYHDAPIPGSWFHSATGDFNGDGFMDYVSFNRNNMDIYWFEHNGQPSPSFTPHFIGPTYFSNDPYTPVYLIDVVVADLDRDGDVEPILLQNNGGVIYFPNLRLSPAPVSLFSPNGGEVSRMGTDVEVSWRTDVAAAGTTVTLDLWRGTSVYMGVLAAAAASPIGVGRTTVKIPNVPAGTDYRVRAFSKINKALADMSDGPITILDRDGVPRPAWMGYP